MLRHKQILSSIFRVYSYYIFSFWKGLAWDSNKDYFTSGEILRLNLSSSALKLPCPLLASSCLLFPLSFTPFEVRSLHLRLTLWQAQDATKHVDFDSRQVKIRTCAVLHAFSACILLVVNSATCSPLQLLAEHLRQQLVWLIDRPNKSSGFNTKDSVRTTSTSQRKGHMGWRPQGKTWYFIFGPSDPHEPAWDY